MLTTMADSDKYFYSGYGIGLASWYGYFIGLASFNFGKNVIILGADKSNQHMLIIERKIF